MVVVIFEVWPHDEGREAYLDIAAALLEDLSRWPGFISIERFESLSEPGKILSLSCWRDEDAVAAWRQHDPHVEAQLVGRGRLFRDYRLRVAQVLRSYGMDDRAGVPPDFSGR